MKFKLIILLNLITIVCSSQNWIPIREGLSSSGIDLFSFDNKLFVGGTFTTVDNTAIAGVAYWDDKNWKSFNPSDLSLSSVRPFFTFKDECYGFGSFTNQNELSGIIKYNKNDNTWSEVPNSKVKKVVSGTEYINSGIIYDAIEYKEELYVIGEFDIIGNTYANNIAKWNGAEWLQVLDNNYNEIQIQYGLDMVVYNNELIISGKIDSLNNEEYRNIAKWNGVNWDNLNGGLIDNTPGVAWHIYELEEFNGDLYAGGIGSKVDQNEQGYILTKWNGAFWEGIQGFEHDDTNNNKLWISSLKVFGNFLIVGNGTNGQTILYNGTNIKKFDQELNRFITSFEIYNNQFYVGGYFGGIDVPNGVAKLGNLIPEDSLSNLCTIFPNPSSGIFFLEYNLNINSKTLIDIYDIKGRLLFHKEFNDLKGRYLKEFNFPELTKGNYLLSIRSKEFNEIKKIIVK